MVHKHFCDVCMAEIVVSDQGLPGGSLYVRSSRHDYDLCVSCANAVERFIKELREKHRVILDYNKDSQVRNQKEMGDFE